MESSTCLLTDFKLFFCFYTIWKYFHTYVILLASRVIINFVIFKVISIKKWRVIGLYISCLTWRYANPVRMVIAYFLFPTWWDYRCHSCTNCKVYCLMMHSKAYHQSGETFLIYLLVKLSMTRCKTDSGETKRKHLHHCMYRFNSQSCYPHCVLTRMRFHLSPLPSF